MTQTRHTPRYEVEDLGEHKYRFCTDKGAVYILSFVYVGIDGIPIYSFNIDRCSDRASNGDSNLIMNTVAHVLDDFLASYENAIISTCDTDGNGANPRYRLFRMWFNRMNDGSIVKKECKVSSGIDGEYTWAMLYYKRSSLLASVFESYFDDYTDMMNACGT